MLGLSDQNFSQIFVILETLTLCKIILDLISTAAEYILRAAESKI